MAGIEPRITEPKRLFSKTLEPGENVLANTGDEKWIISDLWIANAHEDNREVDLQIEYTGEDGKPVRNSLMSKVELDGNQTMIVGNLIVEPNESIIAQSTFNSYAYLDINNLRFASRSDGSIGNMKTIFLRNPQEIDKELEHTLTGVDYVFNLATGATEPEVATLETDLVGANNDLIFTAKEKGTQGNRISVEYVDAAPNQTLLVTTEVTNGHLDTAYDVKITVRLATNASQTVTTTGTQLMNAVNNSADANKWVGVALKTPDTGAGAVTAMGETFLEGEIDAEITTTYKELYDYIKSVEELDTSIDVFFLNDYDGEDIITKVIKTNLNHGDANLYDPELYGLTSLSIIGYGRVV